MSSIHWAVSVLLALLMHLALAQPADALDQNVPCSASDLVNAITLANSNPDSDILRLTASCIYTLTTPIPGVVGGPNGLPVIVTETTIFGNGATIRRDPSAPDFRILEVDTVGKLTLENVTISGGRAVGIGGGGILSVPLLTLNNSTVSGNTAVSTGATSTAGGGIFAGFDLVLTNSTVTGNSAVDANNLSASGGGIQSLFGTATLTNSTVTGNTVTTNGGGGGAGIASGERVTLTTSTVSGNSATATGSATLSAGGVFGFNGLTLTGSTVSGNSATTELGDVTGGGIGNGISEMTLTNSTVSGNSVTSTGGGTARGGGIATSSSSTLTHTTVSGNSASSTGGSAQGGGISASGILTLRATVLALGSSGANCHALLGTFSAVGSNVVDDASCFPTDLNLGNRVVGSGGILLGPLANNGGPTQTHALLAGSPAIDAVVGPCTIDGTAGGATVAVDQRGAGRPRDGDGNGSAVCDAGAFERDPGRLELGPPTASVSEGGGTSTFTVTRTGGTDGPVGATVTLGGGASTATAGADYVGTAVPVSFASGAGGSQSFPVPILSDTLDEPDETVVLTLGAPTGGVAIGPQTTQTLTIVDDDGPPSVGVAIADATESDLATSIMTFAVTLAPPSGQAASVQFATQNGTATGGAACAAGVDYVTTSGTLTFAPGETTKTIPVTVCPDTQVEGAETFVVNLSAPTLATIADAQGVGTITDDDRGGTIAFTAATASVPESAGSVTLTVQRTGSGPAGAAAGSVRPAAGTFRPAALGAVTVSFATANVEAAAGQDYGASAGTLTFGVNETTKTIVIPIINDSLQEGPEHFTVVLSNPTGGAALGPQAVVVVTIIDTTHGAPTPPGDDSADDEREERQRDTEEERRQRARTNQGNKDDDSVEGNVLETHCDAAWPYVAIANRDGLVEVRLVKSAQKACSSIQVGDYLEADGEKIHEHLFDATDVETK